MVTHVSEGRVSKSPKRSGVTYRRSQVFCDCCVATPIRSDLGRLNSAGNTWEVVFLEGETRPSPNGSSPRSPDFVNSCIRPHGMTHKNQILHWDLTIGKKKFRGSTLPQPWPFFCGMTAWMSMPIFLLLVQYSFHCLRPITGQHVRAKFTNCMHHTSSSPCTKHKKN